MIADLLLGLPELKDSAEYETTDPLRDPVTRAEHIKLQYVASYLPTPFILSLGI